MKCDPKKPYNGLPLLPPKAALETPAVLKKALGAARTLAELKGAGRTIPNQAMLINTITLQEAGASSAIENIITTDDALFKAFSAAETVEDLAVKEVLHYREAVWTGFQAVLKRPLLTTNLFVSLVQTIRKTRAGIRNTPGTTLKNPATGEVVYTPPEGEQILRDKLKNLEDYIHADDGVDPLVKMAVIHYQFEAIHPFSDGNGRTGRIINILYLIQQGLLELPVLYMSRAIIEKKSEYYRLLNKVTRDQAWEPWILFMLAAVERTGQLTRNKIDGIRELLETTLVKAKQTLPRRVYSKELIELLFHQPYTKARYLEEAGIAKRQAASGYLHELEKAGILKSQKIGRERLYLNRKLYVLLAK
jgi:Fic family protein